MLTSAVSGRNFIVYLPLGEDLFHHAPVHVSEAEIPSCVVVNEPLVIESQAVKDGRLHVVHMHLILHDVKAHVVRGPMGETGFHAPSWSAKRHKIQVLRDLLREGPEAARRGLEAWRLTDPDWHLPAGLDKSSGSLGESTPLLDALDLLDVYLPLEEPTS